jgi:hypothetical protein
MNFRTRQSYNNRLVFVYPDGEVKQTEFIEVSFHGDDYVLAKNSDDIFYTILDLNGTEVKPGVNVVHRFQNGMLLTYSCFEKEYVSSDTYRYKVNYNVYSVLNHTTGKSTVLSVILSDNLLNVAEDEALRDKCRKTVVKDFLNKPVYRFKDLIFSEIIDYQYIITGTYVNLSAPGTHNFDFNSYKNRNMWNVSDISIPVPYNNETDIEAVVSKVSFKEAELALMDLLQMQAEPYNEDFTDTNIYKDAAAEYTMYSRWRKKNQWQMMFAKMLPILFN